ncbi:MAG: ThuA domain-containing protein [Chloroflexota bacterium]
MAEPARPKALLLTRNDKFHRGIEDALGRTLVEPWLRQAGVDVTRTNDVGVLCAEGFSGYQLFMPWLMPQWDVATESHSRVVQAEAEAVAQFVHSGGGLFAFHGATVVRQRAPYAAYVDVLGTRFKSHPKYHEFSVRVRQPDHPVTRGLRDFRTSDELYLHEPLASDADVLLDAEWEGERHPMVYTRKVGKGAIYYLALGHDRVTWEHPAFRHLVVEGTRWLLDQTGV